MMGMVFEQFFSYVEQQFSEDMVDDIIIDSGIESDGAYTAVGRYEFEELVKLISTLSEKTNIPVEELVHGFGQDIFKILYDGHKQYLPDWDGPFDVIRKIDDHIHVEVQKIYPNATLPKFIIEEDTANKMVMKYQSERPLAKFAEGIIKGCISYFEEDMTVHHTPLENNGNLYQSRFVIERNS